MGSTHECWRSCLMSLQVHSWWSLHTGDPEDWKKANVIGIFQEGKKEGCRELQAGQSHLDPQEGDGTSYAENCFWTHLRQVIWSNQHRFMKGKPCVTDLTDFYNKIIYLVGKGRAVDNITLSLGSLPALSPVTASWTNWWIMDPIAAVG